MCSYHRLPAVLGILFGIIAYCWAIGLFERKPEMVPVEVNREYIQAEINARVHEQIEQAKVEAAPGPAPISCPPLPTPDPRKKAHKHVKHHKHLITKAKPRE